MRPKAGAFSRYRPRVLTVIVLVVVAAPTVLANLSPSDPGPILYSVPDVDYGWPFTWYWCNLALKTGDTRSKWYVMRYGWPRLAGNLAIWLVMLAAAGSACEWLVRRCRPRLRWNLRTMLIGVGLAAVPCAWCAAVRDRANLQDSIIAAIEKKQGGVYVERWGPKWLDLVGADRFRRRIVEVWLWNYDDGVASEELLKRIGRLPDLRHLNLYACELTSGMATALGDLRQLQTLNIVHSHLSDGGDVERISDQVITAIGKLDRLKVLSLSDIMFTGESLPRLAALTNLKSLRLEIQLCDEDGHELEHFANMGKLPLLAQLPALPRLEAIGFHCGLVRAHDLRQLAALPSLKSLDLSNNIVITDAVLVELASLESIEELTIDDQVASAAGLESLLAIKRLKAIHVVSHGKGDSLTPLRLDNEGEVFVRESEVDRCRRAFEELRHSNPGIVIDSDEGSFDNCHIRSGEFGYSDFFMRVDRSLPGSN